MFIESAYKFRIELQKVFDIYLKLVLLYSVTVWLPPVSPINQKHACLSSSQVILIKSLASFGDGSWGRPSSSLLLTARPSSIKGWFTEDTFQYWDKEEHLTSFFKITLNFTGS